MFDRRLIRAEILKLRRRRGLMVLTAAIVALPVIAYTIANVVDPPAGGLDRYVAIVDVLGTFGAIAGIIVGATAGAADLEAGVFRDLAATGRSRRALFGARFPGACAIVVPILLAAVVFEAVWCTALSGPPSTPTAVQLLAGVVAVLASGVVACAVSVGLAALAGSRAPVIGVALAFELAISPGLNDIAALGHGRVLLPRIAVDRIADVPIAHGQPLVLGCAALIAWAVILLAAGARRSQTQEI
jgi:ABC-type transport system involved in multi-copper enzyme maturation permease subunit